MEDIKESEHIVKKSEDTDGDLHVGKLDTSKKFNQAVSENPAKLSNQRYINRTNFFDVHPPLGKMLIAGFGKASGYNAGFNFSAPSVSFEEFPSILGMRLGCTFVGVLTLPLGFLTVWELTSSLSAASLACMLLTFDTAFTVINRYILLDPIMIFFISASFYAMVRFRNLAEQSFSAKWWSWLIILGVSLAGTISVKFVGLFIILYVGAFTAFDLWTHLGDVSKCYVNFVRHLLARVACLILLPFTTYLLIFGIHTSVLRYAGPGDGYYSSLFQSTIDGNPLERLVTPPIVNYGSRVSLKSAHNMPCGYLHSHQELYPEGVGAHQQMVSSYVHRDENNFFTVKPNNTLEGENSPVRSGDLVILEHWATGRNLHSHKIPSVMAKTHFQVTGYGEEGVGDENDLWRVEVEGLPPGAPLKPLVDRVRFRHHHLNCLLTCTSEQLPKEWGFGQQEISCSPWQRQTNEARGFAHSVWMVEETVQEKNNQEVLPVQALAPGFLGKFIESHKMMFYVNRRMGTGGSREEMTLQAPWKWPLNICTQKWSGPVKSPADGTKIVLVGSPAVWWPNLAALVLCPAILAFALFKARRAADNEDGNQVLWRMDNPTTGVHLLACAKLFGAWAVHYLPFFFMHRILYLHHYFPAVYFSCLLTGVLADLLFRLSITRLPDQLKPLAMLSFLVASLSILAYFFNLFAPLVYGHNEDDAKFSNSSLHHLHLVDTWDF